MNGIEKITERILADAKKNGEEQLAHADAEAKDVAAEYAARANELREMILAKADKEAGEILNRARSSSDMIRRTTLLRERSNLLDEAYKTAAEELQKLPENEYFAFLCGITLKTLSETLAQETANAAYYKTGELEVCNAFELILNRGDREKYGKKLLEAVKPTLDAAGKKVTLSQRNADITFGVIVKSGDVENNCSLSPLLAQVRRETETAVYGILFPEADGQ